MIEKVGTGDFLKIASTLPVSLVFLGIGYTGLRGAYTRAHYSSILCDTRTCVDHDAMLMTGFPSGDLSKLKFRDDMKDGTLEIYGFGIAPDLTNKDEIPEAEMARLKKKEE